MLDATVAASLAAVAVTLRNDTPPDRLVVDHLDENGRTFRVFAEHVARGPVLHEEHYTTDAPREARYTVADWAIRQVFAGETFVIGDSAPTHATRIRTRSSSAVPRVVCGPASSPRCGAAARSSARWLSPA